MNFNKQLFFIGLIYQFVQTVKQCEQWNQYEIQQFVRVLTILLSFLLLKTLQLFENSLHLLPTCLHFLFVLVGLNVRIAVQLESSRSPDVARCVISRRS